MSYVLLLNGRWNQTTGTQWNYSLLDWAPFTNCDLTTHRKRSFWILPCALVLTVTDVTSAEGSNNRLYKTLKLKWGRTPLWTSEGTHSFCRNLKKKELESGLHPPDGSVPLYNSLDSQRASPSEVMLTGCGRQDVPPDEPCPVGSAQRGHYRGCDHLQMLLHFGPVWQI